MPEGERRLAREGEPKPGRHFQGALRTLREDEKALETDIDYRQTFRIIGRSVLFVRYVWVRYAISFVSNWIPENLVIVLAPWMGKIIIDHVSSDNPSRP